MYRRIHNRVGSVNLRTRLRRLSANLTWLAALSLSAPATSASPFYDYKIVAQSGDIGGFAAQSFKQTISINDNGRVAFVAGGAGGRKAVFVAEPSGNTYVLRK